MPSLLRSYQKFSLGIPHTGKASFSGEYTKGMEVTEHAIACTLTALYLNGGPNRETSPRRRWIAVDRAIRQMAPGLAGVQELLTKSGFWFESAILGRPGILAAAEDLVTSGQVLVSCHQNYPSRWLSILGEGAPPVFWCKGQMPAGPFHAIVGSRHIPTSVGVFSTECAREAVERGYSVVSGAAAGCDRAAARGAVKASIAAGGEMRLVEILPYGLGLAGEASWCRISLSPPNEDFTTAAAMERNALIYAASDRAVVAHSRFRAGGAWHGAADCLRRRLAPVFVRADNSPAAKALAALGATPVNRPNEPFEACASEAQQKLQMG